MLKRWVMRRLRLWLTMLVLVTGAGALSGCYYDPYTGGYYPYPPYPYPYPGQPPYPYGSPPPPPTASPAPIVPPAPNAPVQQAPLPPPQ
jgi:hypothetical protein